MKNVTYSIGLSLVLLAVIACTISFYLLIFALPLFLVGTILIFISKRSITTKILSTSVPLFLFFLVLFIRQYSNGTTPPETYLIPNDFSGKFRVMYGEECGIQPKDENGRRVLDIPSNGLLIIKPEFEAGTIDHEYYLVDKDGKRTKVPKIYVLNDPKSSKIGVLFECNGNKGGLMPDGSSSSESSLSIEFADFFVLNGKEKKEDYRLENRFDSLANAMVDVCRRKK